MAVRTYAKSESEFPEPHRFGVWWNQTQFQVYRNLSLVKSAITNDSRVRGTQSIIQREIKVYEHTGESWELIYELSKGDVKEEHELWAKGAAPKTLAVSDESVEAAIASILGGDSATETKG